MLTKNEILFQVVQKNLVLLRKGCTKLANLVSWVYNVILAYQTKTMGFLKSSYRFSKGQEVISE